MKESLGDRAIFEVLNRREVENYLISPPALLRFIELKKELAGGSGTNGIPTLLELNKQIDETADKLKQFTIMKRVIRVACHPVFPHHLTPDENASEETVVEMVTGSIDAMIDQLTTMKSQVNDIYCEQTTNLGGIWSTNKLALVPGDILLDMVCQNYGVRFKKDRDGSRLAAAMKLDEIDKEIVRIIRQIGKLSS